MLIKLHNLLFVKAIIFHNSLCLSTDLSQSIFKLVNRLRKLLDQHVLLLNLHQQASMLLNHSLIVLLDFLLRNLKLLPINLLKLLNNLFLLSNLALKLLNLANHLLLDARINLHGLIGSLQF